MVVLGWGAGFGAPDDEAAIHSAAAAAVADAGLAEGELRQLVGLYGRRSSTDLGPAGDVAHVVRAAEWLRAHPTRPAFLIRTRGLDGQAAALVLARPT